jgi:heterogeneous nuclear ribonucleoprotein A1/A3
MAEYVRSSPEVEHQEVSGAKGYRERDEEIFEDGKNQPEISEAEVRKYLEPLSREQLMSILTSLALNSKPLLNEIKRVSDTDPSRCKLFVRELAWATTSETLKKIFERYGDIVEAVVIKDRNTGRSRGFGFVTYKDASSAERALQEPAKEIDGRMSQCNLAALGNPFKQLRPPVPTYYSPRPSEYNGRDIDGYMGRGGGVQFLRPAPGEWQSAPDSPRSYPRYRYPFGAQGFGPSPRPAGASPGRSSRQLYDNSPAGASGTVGNYYQRQNPAAGSSRSPNSQSPSSSSPISSASSASSGASGASTTPATTSSSAAAVSSSAVPLGAYVSLPLQSSSSPLLHQQIHQLHQLHHLQQQPVGGEMLMTGQVGAAGAAALAAAQPGSVPAEEGFTPQYLPQIFVSRGLVSLPPQYQYGAQQFQSQQSQYNYPS